MPRTCVHAYTPASGYQHYPPYFNLSVEDGRVIVTVRGAEVGPTPDRAYVDSGPTVSVEIPREQVAELACRLIALVAGGV